MKNRINIAITMAGAGSRFAKAGYKDPKPFIEICGKPMISMVLDNLRLKEATYLLLAQKRHLEEYITLIADIEKQVDCRLFHVPKLTEGAACTFLSIANILNNDQPLILSYCDQIVDLDIGRFIEDAKDRALDGSILTFKHMEKNTKWSYAAVDSEGHVTKTVEKEPISTHATVGIYYFRRGKDFVSYASEMIAKMDKSGGEYYISPVFNHMINNNKKVGIYEILETQMHGLGTPEDLIKYQKMIDSGFA